jgi:hypothetical protein
MPSLQRTLPLLLAVFVAAAGSSPAQQPSPAAQPDVRLEAHDGKTTFYLGEPIRHLKQAVTGRCRSRRSTR